MDQLTVITRQEFFEGTTLSVIEYEGQEWFQSEEIGIALGFSEPRKGILKVFERNRDEFEGLTGVVNLTTPSGNQEVRVFNLQGCQMIGFFARVPRGKLFRRWASNMLAHGVHKMKAHIHQAEARILALEGNISVRLSAVERQLGRRKHTARTYTPRSAMEVPPEDVAWIQEATSHIMVQCAPLQVINPGERIPDHLPFFILQRPGRELQLYARIEKIRLILEIAGFSRWSTKRLSVAYRELGHRPEQFTWSNQCYRGWAMEMAAIAGGVPDMIPLSLN